MHNFLTTIKTKILNKYPTLLQDIKSIKDLTIIKINPYLVNLCNYLEFCKNLDYRTLYNQYKILIISCILIFTLLLWNYSKILWQNKFISQQLPVVKVQACSSKDLPVIIKTTGKIVATNSVTIRPQVDGIIKNIGFKEGAKVTTGQLLFELDPTLLQANVDQALANFAKTTAELQNNRLKLQRSCKLYQDQVIPAQEHEQNIANFNISKANHAAANANLNFSTTQLSHSKIHAPISAIAGEIYTKTGNLAKLQDQQGLVILNVLDPIQVSFTIDETYLPDLLSHQDNWQNVSATIPNLNKTGKLVFLDNKINDLNGTILLKAEFDNQNANLWPGQLVEVNLTIKTIKTASVIPTKAIQVGQQGSYVYTANLIKSNKKKSLAKVKKIAVSTDITVGDETIITSGLNHGDIVITEGTSNLIDNDQVEIYVP